MLSLEGKDRMGEKGGKEYREQEESTEEEICSIERELKWVQGETKIQ